MKRTAYGQPVTAAESSPATPTKSNLKLITEIRAGQEGSEWLDEVVFQEVGTTNASAYLLVFVEDPKSKVLTLAGVELSNGGTLAYRKVRVAIREYYEGGWKVYAGSSAAHTVGWLPKAILGDRRSDFESA